MGELTHLAEELEKLSEISDVRVGLTGEHVVLFTSDAGYNNCLTSKIIDRLSSYDANLYESNSLTYDWIAVAEK